MARAVKQLILLATLLFSLIYFDQGEIEIAFLFLLLGSLAWLLVDSLQTLLRLLWNIFISLSACTDWCRDSWCNELRLRRVQQADDKEECDR